MKPRERTRRRALLAAALASAALVVALWALGALHATELAAADLHFGVRGAERPDPRIELVLIDARTLQRAGTYPIPRRLHAEVIDRLVADGARVIGYDVVFAERSASRSDDLALLRSIRRAGNVVLAASEADARGEANVLGGQPGRYRATPGSANFSLDPGGVYRRTAYSIDRLPTLAVAVARRWGKQVDPSRFGRDGVPIDFAGPAGTYPSVSFADVLAGRVPAVRFGGRIVIVGASDPNLQDVHPTAIATLMSGAEIQANAVATALAGLPLRRAPDWLAVALLVLLSAGAPIAALGARPRPQVTVLAGLAAGVGHRPCWISACPRPATAEPV